MQTILLEFSILLLQRKMLDVPLVQQTGPTCYLASIEMVTRYWNKKVGTPIVTEEMLKKLFPTYPEVSLSEVIDYVTSYGYNIYRIDLLPFSNVNNSFLAEVAERALKLGYPVIISIRPNHAGVLFGFDSYSKIFYYHNPQGMRESCNYPQCYFVLLSWDRFTHLYLPKNLSSSIHLLLLPSEEKYLTVYRENSSRVKFLYLLN